MRPRTLFLLALMGAAGPSAFGQTISITISTPNPITYGQTVQVNVTSPCDSIGSVQPTIYDVANGAHTALGTATGCRNFFGTSVAGTFDISTLSVGTHVLQAEAVIIEGPPHISNDVSQTVNAIPTTLTVTSSLNPSTQGQQVTITASLSPVST